MGGHTRRSVLRGIGIAAGTIAFSTRSFAASESEDRFVVDTAATETPLEEMADAMEVVYDFREVTDDGDGIDFAVVRGSESDMPADVEYTADLDIEIDIPEQETEAMEAGENDEPLYDLQWDKQEQDITDVHETVTGAGARIGVIDDGVLGANPDDEFSHPDLPNVRADLSINFTDDGEGPGPLNDDHGTHVAGTAAAADNGVGVVGMAPDAEVVDLRVFSGAGASFADVAAATIVGAAPEGLPVNVGFPGSDDQLVYFGAGCDVLNLSLGSGPIPEDADGLDELVAFISAAGEFAVSFGSLPLAAAGNDGTDVDDDVVVLPAEADGYMSVGATGPIGYGWPVDGDGQDVGGLTVEDPIRTELPTEEPANYTNYGAEGVDVTAGGGNFDADAIGPVPVERVLYDLVFATTFVTTDDPEDTRLESYIPSFGFKAGTSFACPNAAGFAALLYEADPDAGPTAVREQMEEFAQPKPVGKAGETTAPGAESNVNGDGEFDGDKPSAPGSVPIGKLRADDYRGEGHINVRPAVNDFLPGDSGDSEDDDGDGKNNGNGKGRGNGKGKDKRNGNGKGNGKDKGKSKGNGRGRGKGR